MKNENKNTMNYLNETTEKINTSTSLDELQTMKRVIENSLLWSDDEMAELIFKIFARKADLMFN